MDRDGEKRRNKNGANKRNDRAVGKKLEEPQEYLILVAGSWLPE